MLSDLDIYRSAQVLIREHGEDAALLRLTGRYSEAEPMEARAKAIRAKSE